MSLSKTYDYIQHFTVIYTDADGNARKYYLGAAYIPDLDTVSITALAFG